MATYTSNYGWTKPSGSDNVDISVLNDNLDDQDSTIHDAFLNMAPPFSESSTYAVDDIVLYTTGLYKCHTAVVTPGSWTGSTNWQVYKLSEGGGGGGGSDDYLDLDNKPQVNGVELKGNKTASDLRLQDELTFDNVPTDGSNNPVKSDGIYDSEKDIYAVMGQMGAKNLIPYPYRQITSSHGITWTDNGDGTITANGTATGNSWVYLVGSSSNPVEFPTAIKPIIGKEVILTSGETVSGIGIRIAFYDSSKTELYSTDTQSVEKRKFTIPLNSVYMSLQAYVYKDNTASNLKIYPMLRLASDTDDTYQPYAKTNRELTDGLNAVKAQIPDAPSADGTYNLSVTVADGIPVYSWVSTS